MGFPTCYEGEWKVCGTATFRGHVGSGRTGTETEAGKEMPRALTFFVASLEPRCGAEGGWGKLRRCSY